MTSRTLRNTWSASKGSKRRICWFWWTIISTMPRPSETFWMPSPVSLSTVIQVTVSSSIIPVMAAVSKILAVRLRRPAKRRLIGKNGPLSRKCFSASSHILLLWPCAMQNSCDLFSLFFILLFHKIIFLTNNRRWGWWIRWNLNPCWLSKLWSNFGWWCIQDFGQANAGWSYRYCVGAYISSLLCLCFALKSQKPFPLCFFISKIFSPFFVYFVPCHHIDKLNSCESTHGYVCCYFSFLLVSPQNEPKKPWIQQKLDGLLSLGYRDGFALHHGCYSNYHAREQQIPDVKLFGWSSRIGLLLLFRLVLCRWYPWCFLRLKWRIIFPQDNDEEDT